MEFRWVSDVIGCLQGLWGCRGLSRALEVVTVYSIGFHWGLSLVFEVEGSKQGQPVV